MYESRIKRLKLPGKFFLAGNCFLAGMKGMTTDYVLERIKWQVSRA